MLRIVNHLTRQAEEEALMNSDFKRHYLGPVTVFLLLFFGEIGVRRFGFPISVAIPYAVMVLFILSWSGLRASLAMALLVGLYPFLFHYEDYGFERAFLLALSAFLIAAPSGVLKRALREEAIRTEYYRLKAIDNINGNRARMMEAMAALDKAMEADDMIDVKKYVQIARIKQADTITLVDSWREIARNQEIGIEKLEQAKKDHKIGNYVEGLRGKVEDE